MAGTILTEKGLKGTFLKSLDGWPSMYKKLCTVVGSKADKEKFAYLGAPPAMREFLGPRSLKRISETTYEIKAKKWEASLRIDQDDIDDDQLGGLMMTVQQMAQYAEQHKDELVMGTTIVNAAATACYDGQYFYDGDHADPEAEYTTSQDNDLTANISDTDAPTTVEFHTAMKECLTALRGFKDSRGKPINGGMSGVVLEGPPCMEYIFRKFANATNLGVDAATNAEDGNMWKGLIKDIIINPYETNADRFRVHVVDGVVKPFIFVNREAMKTAFISPNQKNPDFGSWSEDAAFFGVKARYNSGYGLWQKSVLYIFT